MKDVNPVGLRAARVRENEERIVRAAHEPFARDGYQGTALTAVADAAGVAHRTVYVRFGTKAALLKRVIDVAGGLPRAMPSGHSGRVRATTGCCPPVATWPGWPTPPASWPTPKPTCSCAKPSK